MMKKKSVILLAALLTVSLLIQINAVSAATEEIEILRESFEEPYWEWDKWNSSSWYRSSNDRNETMPGSDPDKVNGTYSAGSRYDWDGQLTCLPLNTSDAESLRIEFYFMNYNTSDGDFDLYYWNGTDYVLQADLTTYGADFPTWVKYSDITSENEYFIPDFRIRFNTTLEQNQDTWVDAVRVLKTVQGDNELDLYTVGQGGLEVTPDGPYSTDINVTLTATPATGWDFVGWGGAVTGNTNPYTLYLDNDKMVVAYFSSTAAIDVSLSKSSVNRGSSINTNIVGGTGEREVMIQYERQGQLVWADQRTLESDGTLNYEITIPQTWIDGTYTVTVKDVESGTVASATFAVPVPTPPPSPPPSGGGGGGGGGVITTPPSARLISLLSPEEAADALEGFQARKVADVLEDVSNKTHVWKILEILDPDYAAAILNAMPSELSGELFLSMNKENGVEILLELGENGKELITEILSKDQNGTALMVESAVKSKIEGLNETERQAELSKLGQALASLNTEDLVDLLIHIAELPETPSTVAYILESMPLSKTLTTITTWLRPSYNESYQTLSNVLNFISYNSLDEIYRGISGDDRTTLYSILSVETIERLPDIGTFEITDLRVIPDEIEEGDEVLISAVITNIGTETDDYVIPLRIKGEIVTTFTGIISTESSEVLDYIYSTDVPGDYLVELNNETVEFTVTEAEPPVVEPTPANLTVTNIEAVPTEAEIGENVSIFVTVKNIGGETGTDSFELFIDDTSVDTKSATLESSEETTLVYVVDMNYLEGEHEVMVDGETILVTLTTPPKSRPWFSIISIVVILGAVAIYFYEQRTGFISKALKR